MRKRTDRPATGADSHIYDVRAKFPSPYAGIRSRNEMNEALAGVLNTCSNLGGALSPILTPYLAARFGWVAALDVAAGFMFCVGVLWLLVHPERRID